MFWRKQQAKPIDLEPLELWKVLDAEFNLLLAYRNGQDYVPPTYEAP